MSDYFKRNAGLFAQKAPGIAIPQNQPQQPGQGIAIPQAGPAPGILGAPAAPTKPMQPPGAPPPPAGGMPQGAPPPPQGQPNVSGYAEPGSLLQFVNPAQLQTAPAAQQGSLEEMSAQAAGLLAPTVPFGGPGGFPGGFPDDFDPQTRGGGTGDKPVLVPTERDPETGKPILTPGGGESAGGIPTGDDYRDIFGPPADSGGGGAPPGDDSYLADEYLEELRNRFGTESFDPIEDAILRQRDEAARNMFEAMAGRGMSQSGAQAGMAGDIYNKAWQDVAQAQTAHQMQQNQQMMGLLGMMFQDKWRSLDREQQITLANLARDNQLWLAKALTALQNEQPGEMEGLLDELGGLEVGGMNVSWGSGMPDWWNWNVNSGNWYQPWKW